MAYLHCGRCRLQIRTEASLIRIENCPRCLARAGLVSPLVKSATRVNPAVGWGMPPAERPYDPRDSRV